MATVKHLELSKNNCKITVDVDENGVCDINTTGSVTRELLNAKGTLDHLKLDPVWVIKQLAKTI